MYFRIRHGSKLFCLLSKIIYSDIQRIVKRFLCCWKIWFRQGLCLRTSQHLFKIISFQLISEKISLKYFEMDVWIKVGSGGGAFT